MERLLDYLAHQGIFVRPCKVSPSFFDPYSEVSNIHPFWSRLASLTEETVELNHKKAESMGLASMAAVHQLDLSANLHILDMCAAPGMKSLYASFLEPGLSIYVNDTSVKRMERLGRLLQGYGIEPAQETIADGRTLSIYESNFFDRVLIDAPCSGEGIALAGGAKQLNAWSPFKVRDLQQRQVRLIKKGWELLKPGGRLVYATCTMNKNENERALKKALGVIPEVFEQPLSLEALPLLTSGQAWRILPSQHSIGFFIAVIDKAEKDTDIYIP